MTHGLPMYIAKEEEKELRILDGLSKQNVYSFLEINTSSKWSSYHHSKSNDTVDFKAHINRSKLPTKCFNCNEDHFVKDCPKPKRTNTEKPQHSDQTIHITLSTSAHDVKDMWQDINKKLEKVKLSNRKFTNYVRLTHITRSQHKTQKFIAFLNQ